MTTRRTFLHLSLGAVAATAVSLPHVAQGQGRTFEIKTRDGIGLFVKDTGGSGRAIVMTHAWPLNADIWDYQAARLSSAGFRVVTYDRRGFGRSDQPAGGYDFDTFADDLADVIQQTGVRDATLVGYSMGGGEVVRYFSRHNGRNVAKAGLVGAAAHYLLKTANNPIGIDGTVFEGIKQGVRGDRRTYLAGLLSDVFLDAKRPATNAVTQEMVYSTLGMAMQAGVAATTTAGDVVTASPRRTQVANPSGSCNDSSCASPACSLVRMNCGQSMACTDPTKKAPTKKAATENTNALIMAS